MAYLGLLYDRTGKQRETHKLEIGSRVGKVGKNKPLIQT